MSILGTKPLLTAVTTTATSNAIPLNKTSQKDFTVHAWGSTSSGTGAATIVVEVSNSLLAPWLTVDTIALTLGTAPVAGGFAVSGAWAFVQARVASISGTGAAVSAVLGT